ncbi:MAG: 30S ribosomal protein S20 [Lachnospiraceae bacterium]|nr:30S ribosomal protein S20 [Lachnospiraceae bacterium]
MANIKSAKKRVITSEKAALRNKAAKSEVKTLTKKVDAAIESGDKAAASAALKDAVAAIDKAGAKGIFHKNAAARKVSSLAKNVNAM